VVALGFAAKVTYTTRYTTARIERCDTLGRTAPSAVDATERSLAMCLGQCGEKE
jgi:hypothetical protein